MLTFKEYQKLATTTAVYPGCGSGNFTYPALGLAGETGEVSEKLKKAIRDDQGRITEERREALARELGDVLWYISALCTELHLSLQDVAEQNLSKLAVRQAESKLHGDGDTR